MTEEVKFAIDHCKEQMDQAMDHLDTELTKIRAGRANPSMLDSVYVDYYGTETPLSQVSNVNTPDAKTISIQPWEKALRAANITDFHWHDLRHTAASYMAMSGVSLVEISKILGHRTMQMVSRYSHLSEGHIVATGEKLASRLGI